MVEYEVKTDNVESRWRDYKTAWVWMALPFIGSVVFVGFLIFSYRNYLWTLAIEADSLQPVILALRVDNLLLWVALSATLGVTFYTILAFITKRYYESITEPSELTEMVERAKSRLGFHDSISIRVHREAGINVTSHRNIVFSSIVVSHEAQDDILKHEEKGESFLAHEISNIHYRRPRRAIIGSAALFSFAAIYLLPEPFPEVIDTYGWIIIFTDWIFPVILMYLGLVLLASGIPDLGKTRAKVIEEYQISESLARKIVFDGLVLTDEEIAEQSKRLGLPKHYSVEHNLEKVCAISVIAGITAIILLGLLLALIGITRYFTEIWLMASMLVVLIIMFVVGVKFSVINDSRPSPYYELKTSSRQ